MDGMVRVGLISSVSDDSHRARVIFADKSIVSGWLYVVDRGDSWSPAVNDCVLCVFLPLLNGDGFILGRLP